MQNMGMTVDGNFIAALGLASVRVTALFMVAPIFNHRGIPAITKVAFGVIFTYAILVSKEQALVPPETLSGYLAAIGSELVVGAMAGFAVSLIFHAVRIAGDLAGSQLGFGPTTSIDPNASAQGSALEQFYGTLALLLFLATDSHHLVLLGLGGLFDLVPVGSFVAGPAMAEGLISLTARMLLVAVQISLPVMGIFLLTDAAMAILARFVPQLNVYFVGLPLKTGLGLVAVLMIVSLLGGELGRLFGAIVPDMYLLVGAG